MNERTHGRLLVTSVVLVLCGCWLGEASRMESTRAGSVGFLRAPPLKAPQGSMTAPRKTLQLRMSGGFEDGGAALLGVIDGSLSASGLAASQMLLASSGAWAGQTKTVLEPVLNLGALAFLIRIVLSWYPQVNLNKLPMNLVAWPTEPFLRVTRQVVPPAFGVDISPIIWMAFLSFLREILISPQGILTILTDKGV